MQIRQYLKYLNNLQLLEAAKQDVSVLRVFLLLGVIPRENQ